MSRRARKPEYRRRFTIRRTGARWAVHDQQECLLSLRSMPQVISSITPCLAVLDTFAEAIAWVTVTLKTEGVEQCS